MGSFDSSKLVAKSLPSGKTYGDLALAAPGEGEDVSLMGQDAKRMVLPYFTGGGGRRNKNLP